jgi:hypothetical protein
MRLTAQARIYLPGDEVFRDPGFFDKISHFLGNDVDLRTGELALTSDALILTEKIRKALAGAGIDNAVSLVVDDDVVFSDTEGVPNDADLLLNAMRDAAARFSRGFEVLRAIFEHTADGIDSLVEVTIGRVHNKEDPSATFAFGSRVLALRPLQDEAVEVSRERIGKLLADKSVLLAARTALSDLVGKVERSCVQAFPRGSVETDPAEISMRKPSLEQVRALEWSILANDGSRPSVFVAPLRPAVGVYYDPWAVHYDDPIDTWATLQVLRAMTKPDESWGYKAGALGDKWHSAGIALPITNAKGEAFIEGRHVADEDQQGYFTGVAEMANGDVGSWDDAALDLYEESAKTDGSWDCASDCASSDSSGSSWDCSSDCSSDCSYDCSSDCSWDCSSDCGGWD